MSGCCRTRPSTGWCSPAPARSWGPWPPGGYLGYALSWIGVDAELADQRMVRSLVASAGSALVVVTALLLERACRVRDDDPQT